MVGKTRRIKIINTYIRTGLKTEEIQTPNQIMASKLRKYGHVKWMNKDKIPKKITGNGDEWKMTQGQTMHTINTPS